MNANAARPNRAHLATSSRGSPEGARASAPLSIEALQTFLPLRGGVLLRYGNPRGFDIDLMAVLREPTEFLPWRLGRIDLFVIGWQQCERLLRAWDPMITEPVQTGVLVAGSTGDLRRLKAFLHRRPVGQAAPLHLVRRALYHAASARTWLDRVDTTRSVRDAEVLLANLTFCCSYVLRARELAARTAVREPVTFSEQLAQSPVLRRARRLLVLTKSRTLPPMGALRDIVVRVEMSLALGKLGL
jgi:hypothetical protein